MRDLNKIQDNVKLLLTKYPALRNLECRKLAIWRYWEQFEEVAVGITRRKWLTLTNSETISRCVRKTQEECPDLRPEVKKDIKRYEAANEFSDHFKKRESVKENKLL